MSGIINATNLEVANIKDSTGTNTAMTVDSSGRLLTPQRPAFFAHGTNSGWTESQTAGTVLVLNATKFNIGNHFNTSNYRFVAPVSGVYQFNATSYVQQANNTGGITIAVNGTIFNHTNTSYPLVLFYSHNSSSPDNAGGFSTCLQLNASDYVTLVCAYNNTDYYGSMSHLSGFLIG